METLFAFTEDGDELSVAEADKLSLSISGRFAHGLSDGPGNLVLQAATALQARFGVKKGAALHLDKRLPIAAGIGGGSADAAAAIRLLVSYWDIQANAGQLHSIAAALGADVPACLLSQTCFGTGIGDAVQPLAVAGLADLPILLINPLHPCPTGPVFAAWDGLDRGSLDAANWRDGRNDLQGPALLLVPVIADVLIALSQTEGAWLTRMSGSGATCFALFDQVTLRDQAAAHIGKAHPNWWAMASRLRS